MIQEKYHLFCSLNSSSCLEVLVSRVQALTENWDIVKLKE
jgi:hypothetical protein